MKTRTIRGGISFSIPKVNSPIEQMSVPARVVIPLKQHQGPPCDVVVKKGQEVKIGEPLAECEDERSAPLFATCSGTVTEISRTFPDIRGGYIPAVTIESDGKEEWVTPARAKSKDLFKTVQLLGIVDGGVDALPLSTKLRRARDKHVETLVINGIDVEPGVSVRHKLIVEKKEALKEGVELLKNTLGVTTAYVAIEKTFDQAQSQLPETLSEVAEIAALKSKYPQGLDKFVVTAVVGKEVPSPFGVPEDVGVCVIGAETAIAVAEATKTKRPPIDQVITVYGAVEKLGNLQVRIGTPVREVLEYRGGTDDIGKVIVGGPMMGLAQYSLDIPVTREMTALYIQKESDVFTTSNQKCINCGSCIMVCPMGLLPNITASLCEVGMFDEAERYHLSYCIECGCCTVVCIGRRPLVHWRQYGKSQLAREEQ